MYASAVYFCKGLTPKRCAERGIGSEKEERTVLTENEEDGDTD